ncbi:MAG TPA: DNA polymerase III subunit epsilon [Candidatus Megaira endosymbiont of Nemacystus decipiens]|nr:DNA polymerase III subunit epsilon [Candidatus Megaera endosymbiont of Nemacystus decipiens]
MREIILDTETTGLNPFDGHRIIEIGAIEMENRIITGREFHVYINPKRDIPEEAYRIHGISTEFLQDKPLFNEIVDEFLDFIHSGKLVIHNARFDIKFLNYELSLINKSIINLEDTIDTLSMARKLFPGAKANLDALCKRFKVDNTIRDKHGALLDSRLLAEVYIELTGGRQSSFHLIDSDVSDNSSVNEKLALGNGLVIKPTSDELENHRLFMNKLKNNL